MRYRRNIENISISIYSQPINKIILIEREEISSINQFMKEKNISFELQGRVRKYLEYVNHNEVNNERVEKVLKKLTRSLRKEVLLGSHGLFLKSTSFFFQNFSTNFIEKICFDMKASKYSPEEKIYKVIKKKAEKTFYF